MQCSEDSKSKVCLKQSTASEVRMVQWCSADKSESETECSLPSLSCNGAKPWLAPLLPCYEVTPSSLIYAKFASQGWH